MLSHKLLNIPTSVEILTAHGDFTSSFWASASQHFSSLVNASWHLRWIFIMKKTMGFECFPSVWSFFPKVPGESGLVSDLLSPEHFYVQTHRNIWSQFPSTNLFPVKTSPKALYKNSNDNFSHKTSSKLTCSQRKFANQLLLMEKYSFWQGPTGLGTLHLFVNIFSSYFLCPILL